jgi:hypothetical protein
MTSLTKGHQQDLDEVSTALITYIDEVVIIRDMTGSIHKKFGIASPYLNLRDAFFHYNKMYEAAESNNNFEFIQQYTCIQEHLNRGLKDFALYFCANFLTKILHELLITKASSVIDAAIQQRLREIYHKIKNIVVEIRLGGQTLQHFKTQETVWFSNFIHAAKDFYAFLDENPTIKSLCENLTNTHFKETAKAGRGSL